MTLMGTLASQPDKPMVTDKRLRLGYFGHWHQCRRHHTAYLRIAWLRGLARLHEQPADTLDRRRAAADVTDPQKITGSA